MNFLLIPIKIGSSCTFVLTTWTNLDSTTRIVRFKQVWFHIKFWSLIVVFSFVFIFRLLQVWSLYVILTPWILINFLMSLVSFSENRTVSYVYEHCSTGDTNNVLDDVSIDLSESSYNSRTTNESEDRLWNFICFHEFNFDAPSQHENTHNLRDSEEIQKAACCQQTSFSFC